MPHVRCVPALDWSRYQVSASAENIRSQKRKAENQATEGGWRCQGPRTLHLYHLWPRPQAAWLPDLCQCRTGQLKHASYCINALMPFSWYKYKCTFHKKSLPDNLKYFLEFPWDFNDSIKSKLPFPLRIWGWDFELGLIKIFIRHLIILSKIKLLCGRASMYLFLFILQFEDRVALMGGMGMDNLMSSQNSTSVYSSSNSIKWYSSYHTQIDLTCRNAKMIWYLSFK